MLALREIAEEKVNLDALNNALIQGLRKQHEQDEPEEDIVEFDTPIIPTAADQALAEEEAVPAPGEDDDDEAFDADEDEE